MATIVDIGALSAYLNKPKMLKLDDDCILFVKQLKVAEFEALKEKCLALEKNENEQDIGPSVDIIVSLVTDDKGKQMFATEDAVKQLKDNLTLDFIRKFFEKFWESFAFTSKELASAEAQFRQ